MAKREMQSWRLLQLEPSALRDPDGFTAPTKLGMDGSHLAATLYSLARRGGRKKGAAFVAPGGEYKIFGQVANRLSGLIDDVYDVWVDRDVKREILTLYVTDTGKRHLLLAPFLTEPSAFWPSRFSNLTLRPKASCASKNQKTASIRNAFRLCSGYSKILQSIPVMKSG